MKLAVVVQRYGPAVRGGTEGQARYVAEHLAQHADVEVLTTCAASASTWANEFSAGSETLNGVQVRRFRVSTPPSASTRARLADRVFTQTHSIADELQWLEACAPLSPSLLRHLRKNASSYDFFLFYGYRSAITYYGSYAVAPKAVLIPRVESDPSIGTRVFADMFGNVRSILFDSPEERSLVQTVCAGRGMSNAVIGAGVDVPQSPQPGRFRQKRNIRGPFAIYVGPMDGESGSDLVQLFDRYAKEASSRLSLVLVGEGSGPVGPVANHPRIKRAGVLDDTDKFDAIAAAEAVIVPSRFQSFSRTALESWALGKPVLANGESKALTGQCVRSNGGLCYRNADEFVGMLQALEQNRWLNAALGRNGRQFVRDHYDWKVVGSKYHDMLTKLQNDRSKDASASMPGWLARRRRDVSPSTETTRSVA
ncbi:MAG TPA: glycosyltransferase [Vicinamibacterales bacterium]|nr:glycosyltransferase [Vicinamibacterales bacterium]